MILKRNKDGGGIKSKRRLGCGDLGEAHPRLQLSSRVDTQILFEARFHLPIVPLFFVQFVLLLLVHLVGCLFFDTTDMHINATVTTSPPGYNIRT
jgi:hypothetical protein